MFLEKKHSFQKFLKFSQFLTISFADSFRSSIYWHFNDNSNIKILALQEDQVEYFQHLSEQILVSYTSTKIPRKIDLIF